MPAGDWKDTFEAIQNGHIALVKHYIESGIDPNYQHPELLTTLLIESIENNEMEIAKYLLHKGANPKLKAGFSQDTPMKVAKRIKNKAAIQLLKPLGLNINRNNCENRLKKLVRIIDKIKEDFSWCFPV